jgi:hypothetical protein
MRLCHLQQNGKTGGHHVKQNVLDTERQIPSFLPESIREFIKYWEGC